MNSRLSEEIEHRFQQLCMTAYYHGATTLLAVVSAMPVWRSAPSSGKLATIGKPVVGA